jgi:2,3,4,5-tetrahydropyridine-2,6-dicarboxylate N-succinyltransferase
VKKKNNEWHTHQWIKKAILLSFKIQDNKILSGPYATWFDKVDGKTALWDEKKTY